MRLEWSAAARADAESIQEYIGTDDVAAAGRMRTRIESAGEQLLTQPLMGRAGKAAATREWVVSRSPYILIYRVTPDVVEVLRIMHGARQWPPE